MTFKRNTKEEVYDAVLQRLNDKAKAVLLEPQSPAVVRHIRR